MFLVPNEQGYDTARYGMRLSRPPQTGIVLGRPEGRYGTRLALVCRGTGVQREGGKTGRE